MELLKNKAQIHLSFYKCYVDKTVKVLPTTMRTSLKSICVHLSPHFIVITLHLTAEF